MPVSHLIGRKNVLEHQDAENSEKAHRSIYFANVLITAVSNDLKKRSLNAGGIKKMSVPLLGSDDHRNRKTRMR